MANCAGVPADHWDGKLLLAHKRWSCQLEYPLEGLATVNLKDQLAILQFVLSVTKSQSGSRGKTSDYFDFVVKFLQEW